MIAVPVLQPILMCGAQVMRKCRPGLMEYAMESIFRNKCYLEGADPLCGMGCVCSSKVSIYQVPDYMAMVYEMEDREMPSFYCVEQHPESSSSAIT